MSEPTLQAQVKAANAYEALFVPALFMQWASENCRGRKSFDSFASPSGTRCKRCAPQLKRHAIKTTEALVPWMNR